jgi:hypothetical protein
MRSRRPPITRPIAWADSKGAGMVLLQNSAVVMILLWSLANCFYGYRIFRVMTAFYSIVFVALLAAFLAAPLGPIVLLLALIVGILVGWLLRSSMYYVIVFIMGFAIGYVVVLVAMCLLAAFAPELSEVVRMIVAGVIGVAAGALALVLHRPIFIAGSAFFGAVGAVACVDFFINRGGSIMAAYGRNGPIWLVRDLFQTGNFIILLSMAVATAAGILVQCYLEKDQDTPPRYKSKSRK